MKQYLYRVKSNVSTGTFDGECRWGLEASLNFEVYDNFTRARLTLGDLRVYIFLVTYASYQEALGSILESKIKFV